MLRTLLVFTLCCLCLLPPALYADQAQVVRIEPQLRDGQLLLDADIEFTLGSELADAAEKGVPLYFTADLHIVRPRWWWFDETIVSSDQTWRIQYNALTQQWRIGMGDLSMPATSLDEALDLVRHIRGWPVGPADLFDPDTQYHGRLRLRLDTSRLARPFQVDALNSNTWSLTTPWKDFTFSISAAAPRD
ncbi:DUF4390 domain-containing protein [Castellaniella sp. UC4442_H9]|jgi:hypothetical protein